MKPRRYLTPVQTINVGNWLVANQEFVSQHTRSQVQEELQNTFGFEISPFTVSNLCNGLKLQLKRNRRKTDRDKMLFILINEIRMLMDSLGEPQSNEFKQLVRDAVSLIGEE